MRWEKEAHKIFEIKMSSKAFHRGSVAHLRAGKLPLLIAAMAIDQ